MIRMDSSRLICHVLGFLVTFIGPWSFSQASRSELCDQDPLRKQLSSSQDILSFTEPGASYSYGTGYREAAIYGKDDRKVVDPLAYPFRTVGKLQSKWELLDQNGKVIDTMESSCTATLVGNCQLLSAKHCVVIQPPTDNNQAANKALAIPKNMRLVGTTFTDALGRKHTVSEQQTGRSNHSKDDYAFLKIDGSPGKDLGFSPFLRKSSESHRVGTKFIMAGFNGDLDNGKFLTADMTSEKVSRSSDPKFLHTRSDSYSGVSGGPTFAFADNNVPYIAAINIKGRANLNLTTKKMSQSYESDDEKDNAKLATSLTTEAFATDLRKFIKDHPCP